MRTLIITFFFGIVCFQNTYSQCSIQLAVTHIESLQGQIMVGLFNQSKGFPDGEYMFRQIIVDVESETTTIAIEDLAPGEYAIALLHDENYDGACNFNLLGLPIEGYGFSNNIKPFLKSPSFEQTKFLVKGNTELTIKLLN